MCRNRVVFRGGNDYNVFDNDFGGQISLINYFV